MGARIFRSISSQNGTDSRPARGKSRARANWQIEVHVPDPTSSQKIPFGKEGTGEIGNPLREGKARGQSGCHAEGAPPPPARLRTPYLAAGPGPRPFAPTDTIALGIPFGVKTVALVTRVARHQLREQSSITRRPSRLPETNITNFAQISIGGPCSIGAPAQSRTRMSPSRFRSCRKSVV